MAEAARSLALAHRPLRGLLRGEVGVIDLARLHHARATAGVVERLEQASA